MTCLFHRCIFDTRQNKQQTNASLSLAPTASTASRMLLSLCSYAVDQHQLCQSQAATRLSGCRNLVTAAYLHLYYFWRAPTPTDLCREQDFRGTRQKISSTPHRLINLLA